MVLAAVCASVPTLAWAASATVESGVKTEIATHSRYDSRCQSNPVNIRIVAQPANGTVTAEQKEIVVANDKAVPQSSQCMGKTVQGVAVYYQSKPGFTGQDSFRYQRLNPRDAGDPLNNDITYTITVK